MEFTVFTRPMACVRIIRHFVNQPFDLFHIAFGAYVLLHVCCSIGMYRKSMWFVSYLCLYYTYVHTLDISMLALLNVFVRTFPCLSCFCGISYRFPCAIRLTIYNASVLLRLCVLSFLNLFPSLSLSCLSPLLLFFFDHTYLLAHFTLHHFHIHSIPSTYVFMWMCIWYDAVYFFLTSSYVSDCCVCV